MRYIIYGAGQSGHKALFFLGYHRVDKFVDNYKAGRIVDNKEIITYENMLQLYKSKNDIILVIASEKYWREMEQQVQEDHLVRYFVFREDDIKEINSFLPSYWLYHQVVTLSYMQSLSKYCLEKYRYIGIYGTNKFLHYLIAEIMEQSPSAKIVIMAKQETVSINTLGMDIVDVDIGMEKIDCLILNVRHCKDSIREKLAAIHKNFTIIDLSELETLEPAYQHKELEIYKNRHRGKRIFVIGNGPSLRIEDLNKLYENGEICIGVNNIYRVYNRTKWRADYIGRGDSLGISYEEIAKLEGEVFLADNDKHWQKLASTEYYCIPNVRYFHQLREEFYPNRPCFSDDLTKGLYGGGTIIYNFAIQFAVYMGTSEIYLLGVDCDYSSDNWKDTHFIKDYYTEDEIKKYVQMGFKASSVSIEKAIKEYEAAERYSRQHGFRIYNATRGGKLEVFERINFESLFKK